MIYFYLKRALLWSGALFLCACSVSVASLPAPLRQARYTMWRDFAYKGQAIAFQEEKKVPLTFVIDKQAGNLRLLCLSSGVLGVDPRPWLSITVDSSKIVYQDKQQSKVAPLSAWRSDPLYQLAYALAHLEQIYRQGADALDPVEVVLDKNGQPLSLQIPGAKLRFEYQKNRVSSLQLWIGFTQILHVEKLCPIKTSNQR